jgi:hypothetical protein
MMKETLARKLNQSGQVPGADKRYSTQQLIASIFGDIASARLKETLERGDHWRLKNEILRGELLPKSLLTPALEQIFLLVSQLIQSSSMTTSEKKDLLTTISCWPVVVRTVADRAAKQRVVSAEETDGENGHGRTEGDTEEE